MKMTVKVLQRNFPECVPACDCAKKAGTDDTLYKVRLHLSKPTGLVIQAVDVTCDCCGKNAYTPVANLGVTRDMLKL